jgi:hypothetical protein
MPFIHTYKCRYCQREFTEQDNNLNSPDEKPLRQHFEVADSYKGSEQKAARTCYGMLAYVGTITKKIVAKGDVTELSQLAIAHWNSLKDPKPGMICAARRKEPPHDISYGHAGHGMAKHSLAGNLGDKLRSPAAAVNEWTSDNCAEVEAAHHILNKRLLQFGKTGGIEFYCIDSHGDYRAPCVNCETWIHKV